MKLASAFEQIADACIAVDDKGHVMFANAAAASLLDKHLTELIGRPLPKDNAAAAAVHAGYETVSKDRKSVSTRWLQPNLRRLFQLHATPAGDLVLVLCWQFEPEPPLADSPAANAERQAAQLKETTQELDSLSYTVSHDLRAPLRHVEAFAGLLEQSLAGKLDAASAEYLTVIGQSARQMSKLLDGVLSYSRLCRRELHRTSVQLDNALKSVLQELKLETEGRTIEWQIQPLPEVQADPWMLRDALARLMSNALKFTRTRQTARICVDSKVTPEETILRIGDNGIGFDMQYVDRLFALFQRLHSDPQFEGIGVGLAHVRRIVLRHGGRVWAEATPDGGATFSVALPRAPK